MAKRTRGKPGKSDSLVKLVPIDRDLTPEDLIGAKVVSVEFGPYGQLVLYFDNDRAISAISTDGESSFFYSVEPRVVEEVTGDRSRTN